MATPVASPSAYPYYETEEYQRGDDPAMYHEPEVYATSVQVSGESESGGSVNLVASLILFLVVALAIAGCTMCCCICKRAKTDASAQPLPLQAPTPKPPEQVTGLSSGTQTYQVDIPVAIAVVEPPVVKAAPIVEVVSTNTRTMLPPSAPPAEDISLSSP